jgi:uncharacterized protein
VVNYTNIYKGTTLISKAEIANSNWEKSKGLMFSKQKDILFNFRRDAFLKFHMVFVFYPIDIIFMDHNQKIVDLKKRFCPFSFYYSKAKSSHVLELAAGTIEKYSLKLGDLLIISERELSSKMNTQPKITPVIKKTIKKRAPKKPVLTKNNKTKALKSNKNTKSKAKKTSASKRK